MSEQERKDQAILPPTGEGVEIPDFLRGDDWFFQDILPYRLDFLKPYEAPRYTLSWDGIPFAPLGGIHAITGQAGNGKTMTLAQFMAAILNGEYGLLRYELADGIPKPRVLYIDTEMEEANTIAVKNRVMTMCGRAINDTADDFVVVMLREVPETIIGGVKVSSTEMRWRMTLKAIYEFKPTVCFIDGLLDVIADFNDNVKCQELIYKCMQVASHYGISLWCCVHQNPGGEKLVGHLGSFLERKVTDIFETKKDKDKTGDVTFNVRQKKARGRDVGDWQFRVLPIDGWGRPEQITASKHTDDKPTGDDPKKVREWVVEASELYQWPMTRSDVKKKIFGEIGKVKNSDKQQADLNIAINMGYLVESTIKSGNGSYMLQPADEMPF